MLKHFIEIVWWRHHRWCHLFRHFVIWCECWISKHIFNFIIYHLETSNFFKLKTQLHQDPVMIFLKIKIWSDITNHNFNFCFICIFTISLRAYAHTLTARVQKEIELNEGRKVRSEPRQYILYSISICSLICAFSRQSFIDVFPFLPTSFISLVRVYFFTESVAKLKFLFLVSCYLTCYLSYHQHTCNSRKIRLM